MVAVSLFLKSSIALGQVVRIQLPVEPVAGVDEGEDEHAEFTMPRPLPRQFAHLNSVLQRFGSLASSELPFVAWVAGSEQIQVACAKAVVAKVFKLLHSKQRELGVTVKDVKTNILVQPMSQQEADEVCSKVALAALQQRGWTQLSNTHLLGGSLLGLADGALHEVDSVQLRAHAQQPDTVVLLLKAEVVKFRHIAVRGTDAADLQQLQRHAQGRCTVLPDFRDGLMCSVRPADAGTLERLRPVWASYGFPLPAAVPYLVDVSFNEDPDAPCFPYPPCCVLSQSGLDPLHSRLDSSAVQSLLARLRDDLSQTSFAFWGGSNLKLTSARVWYPNGAPPAQQARQQPQMPSLLFQSAREVQRQAVTPTLALGPEIDMCSISSSGSGGIGCGADGTVAARPKKPHAHAGLKLTSFLQGLQQEQEAAEAANRPGKPAPSATSKPATTHTPAAPGGPAIFPKFNSSAAPPKPVKEAGQKRPAGAGAGNAKPRAPKAPKPAAAAPSATLPADTAQGLGAAVGPGTIPAAVAAAVGAINVPGQVQPAAVTAGAAASKPRPKAPPLVLDEVAKKVRSLHTAGKLSSLTIPEMKCFLKSVKQPVGGKKAELEERLVHHLSAEA